MTRVDLPSFTVSTSPSAINSYSLVRPTPIMRAASLILTQIGSTGGDVVTAPRLRHEMQPDHRSSGSRRTPASLCRER